MTTPRSSVPPFVRVLAAITAALALLAVQLIAPSPASAHAQLEATSPKDGATLTAAPPEVMLRFNEQIQPELTQVSVKSESTTVSEGSPEIDGDTVYQGLSPSMEAGTYTVTYKVVSADGHPVSGTYSFTYAPPAEEEQEGVASPSETGAGEPAETSEQEEESGSDGTTSDGSSSESPSEDSDEGSSATGPDSPTSADAEPSEETSGSDTGTSTGEGSDTSAQGSEPSESTSTAEASPASGEGDGSSGLPGWAWGAAAAGVLLVLGAITLLTRGRGKASEEEEIALEDWRE